MKKETCGIYVISERATERAIYVGQSIGIEGRWEHHKSSRGNFPKDRFDYRIIQECLPAELNFWEKYYIRALKTHWTEGGENQDWGGQHWPKPEEPMSPATRAKISAANKGLLKGRVSPNKGKPMSEEQKAKLKGRPSPTKGKPMSEETKAKISAKNKGQVPINKGKSMSEEEKAKRSAAEKSRTRSEEEKAKRSAALKGKTKGRVQSEEEKAKRSAALKGKNKGKRMSEEQKAKLSETLKGRVAPNKGKPMSEEQKKKQSEATKAQWALKRAAEAAATAALEALLFTETETILSPE